MKERICCLCGRVFIPTHPRQKVCADQHYRKCEICGADIPIKRPSDPKRVCSESCEMEMRRRHNIEKYGVEHPMQLDSTKAKHRESMLEKYGVESPLQSEEIKQKAIQSNISRFGSEWALGNADIRESIKTTMHERYGVDYSFQSRELVQKSADTIRDRYGADCTAHIPGVREKAEQTNIQRYGARNPMLCRAIIAKARNSRIKKNGRFWTSVMQDRRESTFMEKYGVRNPSHMKSVIQKIADSLKARYGESSPIHISEFKKKMKITNTIKYGVPYFMLSDQYSQSSPTPVISSANRRFAGLLSDRGVDTEFEYSIESKRYDIRIKNRPVVIEVDPTYTHSQLPNRYTKTPIDKLYHKEKTEIAEHSGYRCVHIFDWDDTELLADMLSEKTVVYARQCDVQHISPDLASEFESQNHLQGPCRGQTICYGLYFKGSLVSVMTFGFPRYNPAYQYELLRLCTLRRYAVVGGAERMFKHFIEDHHPKSIISYCDRSKFSGEVYLKLGFRHIRDNYPNIVWSKGKKRITNNMLLARGYDQIFKTSYGKGVDNRDLMIQNGWRPVYDCGQGVYVYES